MVDIANAALSLVVMQGVPGAAHALKAAHTICRAQVAAAAVSATIDLAAAVPCMAAEGSAGDIGVADRCCTCWLCGVWCVWHLVMLQSCCGLADRQSRHLVLLLTSY